MRMDKRNLAVLIPLVSILMGGAVALSVSSWLAHLHPVFFRLAAECAVMFTVYLFGLLVVLRQKAVYVELLREIGILPLKKWKKSDAS